MELGPSLPLPDFESLKAPEDKEQDKTKEKKSKKKKGFEALLPEKREKEAKKIAESLDKSPLFERGKEKERDFTFLKNPEAAIEAEAPLEDISEVERREIISELAHDRKAEVVEELALAEPGSEEAIVAADVIAELAKIEAEGSLENEPEASVFSEEAIPFEDEGEIPLAIDNEDDSSRIPSAGSGSSGGTGTPPPRGPAGPSSPALMGGGSAYVPRVAAAAPNVASDPSLYTSAEVARYEQQAGVRGFLVGGIVGYLIGRRRGRIRTEKRLLPVQRKLEKEVTAISEQLAEREATIRHLSYESMAAGPMAAERLQSRRTTERSVAKQPESRLNLEKPARIERLGKAVVRAEVPAEAVPLKLKDVRAERVRTMSRNELLELGEKVIVEGATLRQIYESHLIGEKGLRRIITEYLSGKDIRKELRREMVEREIDFERDPMLRDRAYQEGGVSTAEASLQQMLARVGVSPEAEDALANVARLQREVKEEVYRKQRSRQRIVDTAMVTVIVLLAAAVVILLLGGR